MFCKVSAMRAELKGEINTQRAEPRERLKNTL